MSHNRFHLGPRAERQLRTMFEAGYQHTVIRWRHTGCVVSSSKHFSLWGGVVLSEGATASAAVDAAYKQFVQRQEEPNGE